MNKFVLFTLLAVPALAHASSIEAIASAESNIDLTNSNIDKYADNISLSADAGWHLVKFSDGDTRVTAGPGFIEQYIFAECKEHLELIDKIKETKINENEIKKYCRGLIPDEPKTDLALKDLRRTLYNTAYEPFSHIEYFSFEKFNFDFSPAPLNFNPVKEKGIEFTTKVVDCTAKAEAIAVLNYDKVRKIESTYGLDVMSRSICIVDKNYGNKLMSAYLKKYAEIKKELPN